MTVDLPENYYPSEDEPYMNPRQLEFFRKKLLVWKEELIRDSQDTLVHLREENWQGPDFNDRASIEIDTAIELRTRDRYRKLIDKIDKALIRIDNGEYGYCEETGEEIGVKRLDARPIATLTIEAQERHESYEKQHSEDDEVEED